MRATTITDWDRKELIIPNKQFVTGEIVNWSLSDTIVRIPVIVGVAYGSDTELATKLLLEVAHNHPKVLTEPAPSAYFSAFGDSALTFELRVFVPTPDDLLPVRHEILMAVDKAFRMHNIEIAFPQRDLHIRSVDAPLLERLTGRKTG
jgi:potassium efflux system protein